MPFVSDAQRLHLQEFAEAFGLGAAYGDFGGALVGHFQHVAGFEPGDDFLDVVDVDQVGAVRAPEKFRVERRLELFDRAVIGGALDLAGNYRDGAVFDRGEEDVVGIHQEEALLRFHQELHRRSFCSAHLGDQRFEALGRRRVGLERFFRALDGAGETRFVEGFQYVVDRVHFKCLDRVIVEGCREDDVGEFSFAVHQLLDDSKAVEAGHLDVEEDKIGQMFFDESESFDAVLALADEVHLGKTLQEEGEFVAGGFFVVYDECVDRHDATGHGRGEYMLTGGLRPTWVRAPGKAFNTEITEITEGKNVENWVKLFRGICEVPR